jgi:hypothetical protein
MPGHNSGHIVAFRWRESSVLSLERKGKERYFRGAKGDTLFRAHPQTFAD